MTISTSNTYTGDGTTVLFSFTFEYIEPRDVNVRLDGKKQNRNKWSFANATTVQMDEAPAQGVIVTIYRETDTSKMPATFYNGSTIQAPDLNANFNVALFVSQEAQEATSDAAEALPLAEEALATANTASADAAAAVITADQAGETAANAEEVAKTARLQAQRAADDAEEAKESASSAASDASSAELAASQAAVDASKVDGVVADATEALDKANQALNTANDAEGDASQALNTANTANTNANQAKNDSAEALAVATAASDAVSEVVPYDLVSTVANIPSTPSTDERVEVIDSTGIESFSPLEGLPSSFVGDPGKSCKLQWNNANSWLWMGYGVTDPDARYFQNTGGTISGETSFSSVGDQIPKAILGRPFGSPAQNATTWTNQMYGGADDVALNLMSGTANNSNWKNVLAFTSYSSGSGATLNAQVRTKVTDTGLKLFLANATNGFEVTTRSTSGSNKATAVTFNSRTGTTEYPAGTISTKGEGADASIIIASTNGAAPVSAFSTDTKNIKTAEPMPSALESVKKLLPSVITLNNGTVVTSFPVDSVKETALFAVDSDEDRFDGVDHGRLVPLLTKAVQELITQNECLAARLDALNA